MPDIKLRNVVKGTVKTFDRSLEHTRTASNKARSESLSSRESSAGEYGANRLQDGMEFTLGEAGHKLKNKGITLKNHRWRGGIS